MEEYYSEELYAIPADQLEDLYRGENCISVNQNENGSDEFGGPVSIKRKESGLNEVSNYISVEQSKEEDKQGNKVDMSQATKNSELTFDVHQYNWHFAEAPSEDIFCLLCKQLLNEPMLTACCGAHFCKTCLAPNILGSTLQSCPNCSESSVVCILDKAKWRNILKQKVLCPAQERGCNWIGEIQESYDHLMEDCEHMDYECLKCGETLERCRVTEHFQNFCPKRQVICEYCNEEGTAEFITEDHLLECPKCVIVCPNGCGDQFEQQQYKEHLKECPLEVASCSYSFLGCTVKPVRKLMPQHFQNDIIMHSQILSRYIFDTMKRVAAEFQEHKEVGVRQFDYYDEWRQVSLAELEISSQAKMKQIVSESAQKTDRKKKINQEINTLKLKLAQLHEHLEHTVKQLASQLPNLLWEVDTKELKFESRIVASGQFNEIWSGLQYGEKQVAIKKHKSGSMTSARFFQEALTLKQLDHTNILKLIGVSRDQILIITEFMAYGNLHSFFKTGFKNLSSDQQNDIIEQIATGMVHLEDLNCIHRAVNSRSILIGENFRCKIGSFSLAKILKKDEHEYTIPQGERVPIKWSAPEVLIHNKCSTKSDVWSFGILQYEIVTGKVLKMSDNKAETFIKEGKVLESPPGCSTEHYDNIIQCLSFNPDSRPSFDSFLDWMDYYYGEM